MSENLDLVRSIFADWERGDYDWAEWAHSEIEYVIADGPAPGRWVGRAKMATAFGSWVNVWDGYRVHATEYRDLRGGRVLVLWGVAGGRGKVSGIDAAQFAPHGANVFDIADGSVSRLAIYLDRTNAFADLGLQE